jgi:hypothetical protein
MWRALPEEAAELSRRGEPNNAVVLIVVLAVSLACLVGVAAMLNPPHRPRWEINLHMTASLLAVVLSSHLLWSALHESLFTTTALSTAN